MKLCCDVFEEMVSNAGRAGFSAILTRIGPHVAFFLQGRAIDLDQEEKLRRLPLVTDPPRPFLVTFSRAIKYCPFCGSNFSTVLANNPSAVELLLHDHARFAIVL